MHNILQSDKAVAAYFNEIIKASVDLAENTYIILTGRTNLQVVNQLNAVCKELSDCYSGFKGLVESDADSIAGLQEALEEFDTALSANGEVN